MLLWNGRTHLINNTRELSVAATVHEPCVSIGPTSGRCLSPCQHHTEIGTDMKKKNRPNDVISIPYRSYVFLYGYTWSFRVHENAWARSVWLILAIFNVFFIIVKLPFRARGARAHNLFSHVPFHMHTFVHGKVFFFPLIDRLVCIIQSNQSLGALIKYVA